MSKDKLKANNTLGKGERWIKPEERNSVQNSDARLLGREFYNANTFPVTFTRMPAFDGYTLANGKQLGKAIHAVPPDEFYFMPTFFYEASWPGGRHHDEVIACWNVGRAMFQGTKPTLAQILEARKKTKS